MTTKTFAIIGAGPVGRAVAGQLAARDIKPVLISRSGTGFPGARAVSADVADQTGLRRTLAGVDVVFQCAQPPYNRWAEEFPALQQNVIDACIGTDAALISAENLYQYGVPDEPISEQSANRPATKKGRVRLAMAQQLQALSQSGQLATAAVRASDFFGPGIAGSAYGDRFFGALAAGKRADLMGNPDAKHSVTYIEDFAAALIAVAEDPDSWGRAWIAPTAPAVTQRRLVELAADAAGVEPRFRTVRPFVLRLAGLFVPAAGEMVEMVPSFTKDYVVDSTTTEQRFELSPTPLDLAIATTVSGWAPGIADPVRSATPST